MAEGAADGGISFPQVYLHGTRADLRAGDELRPGHSSNFGSRKKANHVYVTSTMHAAKWGAELAVGDGPPRIYLVEAAGSLEDDPNVTDKRFPGNPTLSYRTREPVTVVAEVIGWEPHPADDVRIMRERVAELARQGIEAIDD